MVSEPSGRSFPTLTTHTTRINDNSQFPLVLTSLLAGTVPISILGTNFAMGVRPFWLPDQYSERTSGPPAPSLQLPASRPPGPSPRLPSCSRVVPILGMILGNAISAIGVGVNTVSREFAENKDKVETYLAMGASRWEACKPVGVEALKLALLPTVNQMRWVWEWDA